MSPLLLCTCATNFESNLLINFDIKKTIIKLQLAATFIFSEYFSIKSTQSIVIKIQMKNNL